MRRMIALLLLAWASHSTQAVEVGNQVLAVSQAACEHCQVMLTGDLPEHQLLVRAASVELANLPETPKVTDAQLCQPVATILAPITPNYATKVRRHLRLCVMRD